MREGNQAMHGYRASVGDIRMISITYLRSLQYTDIWQASTYSKFQVQAKQAKTNCLTIMWAYLRWRRKARLHGNEIENVKRNEMDEFMSLLVLFKRHINEIHKNPTLLHTAPIYSREHWMRTLQGVIDDGLDWLYSYPLCWYPCEMFQWGQKVCTKKWCKPQRPNYIHIIFMCDLTCELILFRIRSYM